MSSNPFTDYPFWHFFTLRMQNLPAATQTFRETSVEKPIKLSGLELDNILRTTFERSFFYDPINDVIIRGDDPSLQNVVITNVKTLPDGGLTVIKLPYSSKENTGGYFLPFVGVPRVVKTILDSVRLLPDVVRGKSQENLKNKFLGSLTDSERLTVNTKLQGGIYQDSAIKLTLESYTRPPPATSTTPSMDARVNLFNNAIPNAGEKSINVTTGGTLKASASRYMIKEYNVKVLGSNDRYNVKFAFPNNLKSDEIKMYEDLLKRVFDAKEIEATTASLDQRRAIMVKPIESNIDYTSFYRGKESFQSYIRNLTEFQTSLQPTITSQNIVGEEIEEEDEEYNEDYEQ